ncbi:hypothetical protein [Dyella sp. 2RAB6]|uniref:hypothetical protein n=1 Tax=Dyella sp. 2RAB6 TaxID=3232992 RepID=UPI003F90F3A3
MIEADLNEYQSAAIEVFRGLSLSLGFEGEVVAVGDTIVYQAPLPQDADISGVFLVVDAEHADVLLYLTLPRRCGAAGLQEAATFAARSGCGLRFGAVEFDAREGTLRVRDNVSVSPAEMPAKIPRLFGRAVALARELSPRWQSICRRNRRDEAVGEDALQRFSFT